MVSVEVIKGIVGLYKAIKDKDESINKALHSCSEAFSDGVFTAEIAKATDELVKELVGDKLFGWIDWFIWEDDFGLQRLKAGDKSKTFHIKNIEDFIKLLQYLRYIEER